MISGTSKIWSKYGPVDLPMITKMLQRMQENMESSLKILFSYLRMWTFEIFRIFQKAHPFCWTICLNIKLSSKAPDNYSASIWYNNISICLWEKRKFLISMISGFLYPSPSPKTDYLLSLEAPRHLKKIKKKSKHIF